MTTRMSIQQGSGRVPFIERLADLPGWLGKKSHFLFGPRQTGKTTWIRRVLPEARV